MLFDVMTENWGEDPASGGGEDAGEDDDDDQPCISDAYPEANTEELQDPADENLAAMQEQIRILTCLGFYYGTMLNYCIVLSCHI